MRVWEDCKFNPKGVASIPEFDPQKAGIACFLWRKKPLVLGRIAPATIMLDVGHPPSDK